MIETLRKQLYPLGFQCGVSFWQHSQLTPLFRQPHPPARTYLRQWVATELQKNDPDSLSAAELEVLTTINLVLLQIARHYLQSRNCRFSRRGMATNDTELPLPHLDRVLHDFLELFPALPIELGTTSAGKLMEELDGTDQLNELVLELFLLHAQSQNRAIRSAQALFLNEEAQLRQSSEYHRQLQLIDQTLPELDDGFQSRPVSLLARLLEPLQQTDLQAQLQFLQREWGSILPEELLTRISGAIELWEREGYVPDFPGEPETVPLDPTQHADQEYANFTADLDWMPRTVLLAKSTYVWLQQLSRKYNRHIHRLDQIPDQELDQIGSAGFTSLWLIGIWQRSRASQKIKHLCGQLQVTASAYAIADYRVADDLGGDLALENLRERCRQRGIDLACDVVTNHTGIESSWLEQHPDWFIQVPQPPYPGYQFSGPDLSESPTYSIQIEDGYYNHSEAAVVCRYQHRHNGEIRYIYHGNDGTHLPWNDTAQLNYLLPQVREAMIQLIIQVAQRFRVIRFDAAMTLAKRHFQRLWFPLPGGGEGVPSRGDHALTNEEFNRLFPTEFWRELVDRIRLEAPDTLLIAEAFWLMEGYFVRTLGMHRVYNSAFMNMLKQEENAKYRQTIKNVLAFDPAILQRFVNFMSNPDEKPAIEQFGHEDKYFCVATLLATMPGLPMFAHGQIEGYHEKYGMEYFAPRWQEEVDLQLVERHRRQIFPLLRTRALFSGSESYQLYDFISAYGIEENVFAYSNQHGTQRVLVLCNNSPHQINGRLGGAAEKGAVPTVGFIQACDIDLAGDFLIVTDLAHSLQRLIPCSALGSEGSISLPAYAHLVLTGFATVVDTDGRWQQLWQRHGMNGRTDLYADHAALRVEPLLALSEEIFQLQPSAVKKAEFKQFYRQLTAQLSGPLQSLPNEQIMRLLLRCVFLSDSELPEQQVNEFLQFADPEQQVNPNFYFDWLDRLFNQREWRKRLSCHYYLEVDYFNQEDAEKLLRCFFLALLLNIHSSTATTKEQPEQQLFKALQALFEIRQLAEETGYKVDIFLEQLDQGPLPEPPAPKVLPDGLKVLFITSEAVPFAKTGGLADVAGTLPGALRRLGHDARVIMPCYRSALAGPEQLRRVATSIELELDGQAYRAGLKQAQHAGTPFWFIDCPEFFDREALYGTASGDYPDNSLRFGFFCRAVLELVRQLDFKPDVIHLHDWQTGFIPLLLRTEYSDHPFFSDVATLLTIHNLGYQGNFPDRILQQLRLPESAATVDGMEYFGQLSALKAGINYSDLISTVSPSYCQEIQTAEQGYGFDGILRARAENLYGILNGLDTEAWDPANDPYLAEPYTADDLTGKHVCKQRLQQELGLDQSTAQPLVAVISRLDRQKGIDLLEQIWPQLLERQLQFVLLGSGTAADTAFWQGLQNQYPGQVSISLTFNEALSHRLYAAADLLIIPSRYEPCGLTQMIALRYGSVPLVRKTGGLADTVIDADQHESGFGFVFEDLDATELLATLDRALASYRKPQRWKELVKRGMEQDFSWSTSAQRYEQLYLKACRHSG